MKKLLLFLLIAGIYLIHQDVWNWRNADLVFGFLPVGLAYHAAYSILAAIMMAILVKFAWPAHLEKDEPGAIWIECDPPVVEKKSITQRKDPAIGLLKDKNDNSPPDKKKGQDDR